jgi:hypothetical protein
MKILKVRRGFTTNSSASSEWVPPEDMNAQANTGPGNNGPENSGGNSVSSNGRSSPTFTPYSKVWLPMKPQASAEWSNAAKGGGLVAIVACAFIADRIWRVVRRRKPAQRSTSPNEDQDELE